MSEQQQHSIYTIVRIARVMEKTGMSESTIYKEMQRTVQRIVDLYGVNAPFLRRVFPINRDISRELSDVPVNSGHI